MNVQAHPRFPRNPDCGILTNFATSGWELRDEHKEWLNRHVMAALMSPNPPWVYVRGFASRRWHRDFNLALSRSRVQSVVNYLSTNLLADTTRIRGVDAVGEALSTGNENDNSPRWRSVEVVVTHVRQPEPHPVITPPQAIERRVRCWLTRSPRMRGGMEPGWAEGGPSARAGEWLWRHHGSQARTHLQCVTAQIPTSHRVVRIGELLESWDSDLATAKKVVIKFDWGQASGSSVSLYQQHASGRPTIRNIDREEAHGIYTRPAEYLRSRDLYF